MAEDNGNGKKEPVIEKTSEQLASERFSRYQANPDAFTENRDLVIAVKRTPSGDLQHLIHGTPDELETCLTRLTRKILNVLNNIELQAEMSKQKIIPAKGSMFDFARRRK